ncbi:MAG: class 1 fructose-bisphosphatase [Gammaproteobacteria bacterium]
MAQPAPVVPLLGQPSFITLQSHVLGEERRHPGATGTLSWIISALSIASKTIAAKLKTAGIEDVLGEFSSDNVQGERQQKLDVIANHLLIQLLRSREGVAVIGSEENDELLLVDAAAAGGRHYSVLFDPLDGSSNLDVGGGVGTIFSICQIDDGASGALHPGRRQVAAGYVLYGPSTIFVLTTGHGVHMFVLDPAVGAFIRVAEHLQIPARGKTYSVNEANLDSFPEAYRRFLAQCRARGYSSRYAGAMVVDVHRVMIKGGIFLYPPTAKAPDGKLRLMYEANPMAMLIEQASGRASTGTQPILDVQPQALHQRVPVILGSAEEVAALEAMLATS